MRKLLLTLPVLLLASCGVLGGPPAPNPDVTTPTPKPEPIFIPAAGAAVGTGDGTKLGTVYVSPNQQEVEFMTLLNEVRTKGTVNGTDVRTGTCLEGVQPDTLKPLTFNGVMAYAARKHSEYLGTWGMEGHEELNSSHPNFYGATHVDRINRAHQELAGGMSPKGGGEIINAHKTAAESIKSFLHSPPHCRLLAQNNIASVGVGYVSAVYQDGTATQPTRYKNNWTIVFGR